MIPGGQSNYYWLTSLLAARGLQARTARVVAFVNGGVGLLPMLLILSPAGPHGPVREAITVAIAVYSLAVASVWLRHSWPSQRFSIITVTLWAIPMSAACLVMSDPMLGMLATISFIFATGYVAFLHPPILLVPIWGAGAITLGYLAVRIGMHDPALAFSAAAVIALVNVYVFYTCRTAIDLSSTDIHYSEIEQLTGLLNTDGLYARAANLLAARNRQDDRHMVLAVVSIDSFPLLASMSGPRHANRARIDVSQALRETVRRGAIAAHISDSDFIVADTFTTPDASPLIDRIQGAMKSTPSRVTASIGVVCTPLAPLTVHPPEVVIDALLAAAAQAMERAREDGGNDVRYDVRDNLPIDE
ncbi:GGDEF domain-containing protein [Mycobacterium sp. CBMA293]|uniref:GGDEF domain-containing protein n=2 Tax=Mycolicibacterium TaxID=1866885 RepID=UPI0012DDB5AB|nr:MULTISPECIES: GGDEF domain-containing protein [unclassified Mycolicibacterium]MUL48950.1 GGDEF domain-containing protein [Mycolicibacterium sp. CBMA 360]MUL58636.1 GGDEF domain-containing protein [Mycolicibacterium sp. CBMA 335]MUL74094.1 GGDEF domain-containing protein [Mycolicibacterium sp. CBMA 311]MUL93519.1 GGDEF domain-containing protein [Mycolicibacterium sp. CBMA 230]MUM04737.1 GGDEF domain-containing protein [Mycolicibacterium sp. CBMA 213]